MNDMGIHSAMPRPRNGLSLCAGAGGLDMGLGLAEPGFHTRCYVEIEPYPRECIIAAQRGGYFAPAPIWTDIKTFDGRPWAGKIDTILAGYPCQPFSAAGQRRGADDPRHLWPEVSRIIGEIEPRWIFLENVAGHVSLGLVQVLRELWGLGFTPAAGLFTASETGAPHERKRVFIVAHRDGDGCERRPQLRAGRVADQGERRADAQRQRGEMADSDGRHAGSERQQRGGQQRFHPQGRGAGNDAMVHAASPRCQPARIGAGVERESWQPLSGKRGHDLADTGQPRPQGREQPGSHIGGARAGAHGSTAERSRAWLYPPGPGERDAWAALVAEAPHCAPAASRGDIARAAQRAAALLDAEQIDAIESISRGMEGEIKLGPLVEQAERLVGASETLAGFRQLSDGIAARSRALRVLGNGVVPLAAAYAWRSLANAHGLRPLDLGATGEGTAPPDAGGPDLMDATR